MATAEQQLLVKLKTRLDEATEEGDAIELVEILVELRKLHPSVALLKQTKLGLAVQRLVKRKEEDVVVAAKLTLEVWTQKKKDGGDAVKEERRKVASTPSNSGKEAVRQRIEDSLHTTLEGQRTSEYKDVDLRQIARLIEDALFEKHKDVKGSYADQFREISAALRNVNNTWLSNEIISGSIEPTELVLLAIDDLASPAQKASRKALLAERSDRMAAAKITGSVSEGMFTCGKCRSGKVIIERQLQTRSADEPMTMFLKCFSCSNRWKE